MILWPGTVIDSSVLLDVFTADERWVDWSVHALREGVGRGPLIINAVVFAEVSPRFTRIETLNQTLPPEMIIEEIPRAAAFLAGKVHAEYRRSGGNRTQILPDFLIGAHAAVTGRPLLTRDPRRVSSYLNGLNVIAPNME